VRTSAPAAAQASPTEPQRGGIFFLPGDASISPSGRDKIKGWVTACGTGGRWSLLSPVPKGVPESMVQKRHEVLQKILFSLGVKNVPTRIAPPEVPEGIYQPVYLIWEP
jgi:hypothetical protein